MDVNKNGLRVKLILKLDWIGRLMVFELGLELLLNQLLKVLGGLSGDVGGLDQNSEKGLTINN